MYMCVCLDVCAACMHMLPFIVRIQCVLYGFVLFNVKECELLAYGFACGWPCLSGGGEQRSDPCAGVL